MRDFFRYKKIPIPVSILKKMKNSRDWDVTVWCGICHFGPRGLLEPDYFPIPHLITRQNLRFGQNQFQLQEDFFCVETAKKKTFFVRIVANASHYCKNKRIKFVIGSPI